MQFAEPQSVKKIAEFLGISIIGNPELLILGINEIHQVQSGDLTFVDHPKYYQTALHSKATVILINTKDIEIPKGKTIMVSENPFDDFMKLSRKFRPFQPSEQISKSAVIGNNTHIQPGAFIGNHVAIGDHCIIHANATIYDHTVIGNHCIIHANTVIGADAFYFQKRDDKTEKFESIGHVVLGDYVEVGALCTIDRGVTGITHIGDYTKFDDHVHIGHDVKVGKRCLMAASVLIGGNTVIEDDVVIWGQSVIDKNITIGAGAVIMATSAIGKSMEGGKTYFGAPAVEYRKKWKELAIIRRLPELEERLKKLEQLLKRYHSNS